MLPETNTPADAGGEDSPTDSSKAVAGGALPPAEFVYDNGQIMLELLRGRAAEEARRRLVEGLSRLRGHEAGGDEKR